MDIILSNQILYILVFIFGILTSFTDIKKSKIYNGTLIFFTILGISANILCISYYHNYMYFIYYFLIILISILIGFGFYYIDYWSAGDGKLIIAYSCIFPFSFLVNNQIYFLMFHLILFVNIFVSYFLVTLIQANILFLNEIGRLNSTSKDINYNKKLKISLSFYDDFVSIFVMTWIISVVLKYLIYYFGDWIINYNFFITLFIAILFIYLFSKINIKINLLKKINFKEIILTLLLVASLYFQKEVLLNIFFWIKFFVYYVILSIVNRFFRNQINQFNTKSVHIMKLKPNMILKDMIILENGEIHHKHGKKSIYSVKNGITIKSKTSKKDNIIFKGRLNNEDVFILNSLYKKGALNFNSVEISLMIPFAPIAFFGVFITIILKGVIVLVYFI